ncbi:MAG TPA: hypothetical protein ENN68_07200 [Methanomicrobia archaeon]|nr:hypothetical protein [Methanomicrobia archaeon]
MERAKDGTDYPKNLLEKLAGSSKDEYDLTLAACSAKKAEKRATRETAAVRRTISYISSSFVASSTCVSASSVSFASYRREFLLTTCRIFYALVCLAYLDKKHKYL